MKTQETTPDASAHLDVPVSDPGDGPMTPEKRLRLTSKSPKLRLPVESDSSVGRVTQRRCLWRRASS